MSKKMLCSMVVLVMVIGLPAYAATTFTGAASSDFNDAANWDNGLPGKLTLGTGGDAVVNATAVVTADYAEGAGDDGFVLTIGSGTSGSLTLPAGLILYPADGFDYDDSGTQTCDTLIGVGVGGVGTFNIAGAYTSVGAGVDMFIGDAAGGYGVVNVLDGGLMDIRKAVEIINGKLTIGATALMGTGLQDELVVDNGGTLEFILGAADLVTPRYHGKSLLVELGSASTLELTTTGAVIGDSWLLIDDITSFGGVDGGDGTGVFGSVVNNEGLTIDIGYDGGALTATVIPEPATMALLGLGSLVVVRRRRK